MANSRLYTPKPMTDIFTADTDINRRNCRRTVPMKVLILGLGRTGTASMRAAMRELGYIDTYHMMSASIENPPDCLLWRDAFDAKYHNGPAFTHADWDQLLGHCQAVSDWPAVAFAPELIAAYPEAKIILTNREVDSWHASTLKTVNWRVKDWELEKLKGWSWAASMYKPMLQEFFDCFFKGDFENQGKQIYTKHYENVRNIVKAMGPAGEGRLLEYKITDGWENLCEFLGEAVPKDRPFPRVNDNNDFIDRSRWRNRCQLMNVLFRYFCIVVGCGMTYVCLMRIWNML
ncbi:hypothetical protein BOTCAL_0132g00030 [Botryotinia calthae]|uniref:NAD dependent epimerase/dehydratase n=1 Tax=Botryotinia calthae TaxID=38488 RepID=A0A4Y8D610_9HELO|nr:hypothetical protein BOTCAL_0132g00030 [Botryotinia calthae]